ncbi:MAG TPA: hypothetical protein VFS98_08690 [Methylomirabilota bacterium]|nr:hypothetical protein [Methylomirabilota bacterium]
MTELRPRWRLTCSCDWERECLNAWAANASAKLHIRFLGEPAVRHIIEIKKPPDEPRTGQHLKALGLTIPSSLLQRADQVIQ